MIEDPSQQTVSYVPLRQRLLSHFIDAVCVSSIIMLVSMANMAFSVTSWMEWYAADKTSEIIALKEGYEQKKYSDFEYENRLRDYQDPRFLKLWQNYDQQGKSKQDYMLLVVQPKEKMLEADRERKHPELAELKQIRDAEGVDQGAFYRGKTVAACRYEATRDKIIQSDKNDIPIIWIVGIVFLISWIAAGSSSGKMALHSRLVDIRTGLKPSFIKCLIRYVVFFSFMSWTLLDYVPVWLCYLNAYFPYRNSESLTALWLFLPYITVPFTKKKQALHDIAAGTSVIRDKPGQADYAERWPYGVRLIIDMGVLFLYYCFILVLMALQNM